MTDTPQEPITPADDERLQRAIARLFNAAIKKGEELEAQEAEEERAQPSMSMEEYKARIQVTLMMLTEDIKAVDGECVNPDTPIAIPDIPC